MNYLKSIDLVDYELTFTKPYEYLEKKYKSECLIKIQDYFKSILLKTPKLQLQSNIKSGYIVVNITNNNQKNINFLNFIKDIEISAQNYLKKQFKFKSKIHSNFIGDTNSFKYIFKTNNSNFSIYDKDKNKIDSNNVEIYSDIILLIKLQNIWIDISKKKFGLNWTIIQCRSFPEIDYNTCIIYDSENEEENIKKEFIVQKCIFCNSTCIYTNTFDNINIGKGKGKGKGKTINTTNNINSGRGNITKTNNETNNEINNKKNNNKKDINNQIINIAPTADELINMKNKLKKMIKIESDSD